MALDVLRIQLNECIPSKKFQRTWLQGVWFQRLSTFIRTSLAPNKNRTCNKYNRYLKKWLRATNFFKCHFWIIYAHFTSHKRIRYLFFEWLRWGYERIQKSFYIFSCLCPTSILFIRWDHGLSNKLHIIFVLCPLWAVERSDMENFLIQNFILHSIVSLMLPVMFLVRYLH